MTRDADAAGTALKPFTIVTGGSEGIGAALARRYAARKHDLLLIARSEEKLAAIALCVTAFHSWVRWYSSSVSARTRRPWLFR